MKKIFFAVLVFFTGYSYSQVVDGEEQLKKVTIDTLEGWKTGGLTNINFSQTKLTNWAAGGENSLAVNGIVSLFSKYTTKQASWDSNIDLAYGVIKQGSGEKIKMIKTDDKIDISTKYGQKAFEKTYYAALLSFKTQFADGFKYPDDSTVISGYLAPGYLIGAVGLDYKPNDKLSFFLAPLTTKYTVVNIQSLADAGAFGVEKAVFDENNVMIKPGKNSRWELGGYMKMMYKQEIMKNVNFQTRLDLFSNYIKNPQNIDINWEVLLAFKVNKYITSSISTQLLYDDDVLIGFDTDDDGNVDKKKPAIQFKEILAIGLSLKF